MEKTIRERLMELADEKYRLFHSGLVPDTDNILGVRLPHLRALAQELAKGDWRGYLATAQKDYYEEIMLQGLVIGYAKADIEEILQYVTDFVPQIANWGICDSFCSNLKITKRHKARIWKFLQPYLLSGNEFVLRFGIVMLLDYYIEDEYIDRVLACLDKAKHNGYYVKMAVAWAVSVSFVKFPDKTMRYLQENTLDDFTYNKALQKTMESFRVDRETKAYLRGMKRKVQKGKTV
ncbi:DNA alkylation repair protein [Sporomusa acidovorans]|uniref:DNA alkylation repair enzyme n=1 Tax=Sporomusa acidovorans (strain ATCC 49682 / DSM 3132 / Mol) TaxID=1123286 RepID=A0ABZ3IXR2_SPOA4|nr:DNA alkylation repair protein [Sporomusa acidovorans]OZC22389.1 DNA alkylation repair enzyme [Sporomusa acidovorans DSM 3132]SDE47697.1 3-methyladenine DNA glycosylase AlkD [Sporomusa acidovorans]